MSPILKPAKKVFMQALQKAIDLSPDFLDHVLIDEIRYFAKELNNFADEKEQTLRKG